MLTWRYHKNYPLGKLFDTEGIQHPKPESELNGWFDTPAKLHITQDQLIDAIVRKELASQDTHRSELEGEVKKKTGAKKLHFATKDSTLVKILDNK